MSEHTQRVHCKCGTVIDIDQSNEQTPNRCVECEIERLKQSRDGSRVADTQ